MYFSILKTAACHLLIFATGLAYVGVKLVQASSLGLDFIFLWVRLHQTIVELPILSVFPFQLITEERKNILKELGTGICSQL